MRHENSTSTGLIWAFSSETSDFSILIIFVVFQNSKLDLLSLVLDFLWGGVILLLSLLTTSPQSQDKMKSGFLLDVVVAQCAAILKLLSGKDETLLIRWNSFFILNFGFDIVNGITWLNLKGDGFARGLHKNLHVVVRSLHAPRQTERPM